jgi:hypothetical protein
VIKHLYFFLHHDYAPYESVVRRFFHALYDLMGGCKD